MAQAEGNSLSDRYTAWIASIGLPTGYDSAYPSADIGISIIATTVGGGAGAIVKGAEVAIDATDAAAAAARAAEPVGDASLASRARAIQSALLKATAGRTTTAVLRAYTPSGEARTIVATSEQYFRASWLAALTGDEIAVAGPGHAEINALVAARQLGLEAAEIGASRPVCFGCQLTLNGADVTILSPQDLGAVRVVPGATLGEEFDVALNRFDRKNVLAHLEELSPQMRMAYALACAERLIPLYAWFQQVEEWGDERVLKEGVNIGWRRVMGEEIPETEVTSAILRCEEMAPDTEDFDSPLASRALDAASAVSQALTACSSPEPEDAADAGEIAWECAFGVEQSGLLEAGVAHIADESTLEQASQGGFVRLEEDLQSRSLQWLRRDRFTADEVAAFRGEFAHLGR